MDKRKFDDAVEIAKKMYCTALALLDNPEEWIGWYYRSLDLEGEQQTSLKALIEEARSPDRRSQIAATAVNLINDRRGQYSEPVEAYRRRGPSPEGTAARNLAALCALWFLSERLGLKPLMRNEASEPLSVCDAVSKAINRGYKSVERIWTRRSFLIRQHPLIVMTLWAALPSAAFLGIPPENN